VFLARPPVAYHSAGTRWGTATFKFYEGRDILSGCVGSCCGQVWWSAQVGCPGSGMFRRADMHYECTAEEC
jgi:hypothetical protein